MKRLDITSNPIIETEIIIVVLPTRTSTMIFDFSDTCHVGDTMEGTKVPFVGLLGAYLAIMVK